MVVELDYPYGIVFRARLASWIQLDTVWAISLPYGRLKSTHKGGNSYFDLKLVLDAKARILRTTRILCIVFLVSLPLLFRPKASSAIPHCYLVRAAD